MTLPDPRQAQCFRFVRRGYVDGVVELVYAFDDGPELIETITFPDAPVLAPERAAAFAAALDLLHFIAGVSYYKAGVPASIVVETRRPDATLAAFLDELYLHGLGEFAWQNGLDLDGRIRFPIAESAAAPAPALGLPRRTLVPIGGGKDSLVSIELLKAAGEPATTVWVGNSPLIEACAARTGLPTLNIARSISPVLFDYNRLGAWNGHIPVTAINSAILVVAALLFGFDAIAFSNERSASSATLEAGGREVNHQWSKGWRFEDGFRALLHAQVARDLDYCSLLRPWSELAVAARFARETRYDDVFSSCNRNFRILGPKPADRWCGQCPKCHFVFLALAPFMPKPRLLAIFGRNLLDDEALAPGFDALVEYRDHKPFECVGEGQESRAAFGALARLAEWREDVLVERYAREIAPQLAEAPTLDALLEAQGPHHVPSALRAVLGLA
ncbi:UDP-N-acetyl-alpha-D-muramoyl-L-alanyl-L-glutamate epimerase [Dokdonella sp.]|uniref:UDP-N-acetyl-alpha-D-muramoyl-L-alanyl-L- glutamate epimerase n=1 Tax=Dokdonella sp. TaxID=2291710 RepID=UPI0032205A47